MTHSEFSRRGGKSMSTAKREALKNNAAKARAGRLKKQTERKEAVNKQWEEFKKEGGEDE